MSVRPVTHFVAVCDGCVAVGECAADEQSAVHGQLQQHNWIVTGTGLLCPQCQPCTECSHNSGPLAGGLLCPECRAVTCAGCGHLRGEHLHFINGALHRIPVYTCLLATGAYVDCHCPFIPSTIERS